MKGIDCGEQGASLPGAGSPAPPAQPPGIRPRARKITLLITATLTIMSGATIAPSLPGIAAHFTGAANIELMSRLVLTLPALFVAFCAPLAGGLADRFGRRRFLIGAVLLFALSGMSGLFLDSLYGLLAGRALLGVAVAGVMTTTTALAGDYFSGSERDRFMGLQATFTGLGGLIFLSGGGLLADLHWRAAFAVYGLAFLLLPAVHLFLSEPSRPAQPAEPSGQQVGNSPVRLAIAALIAVAFINSVTFYLVPTQLPFYLKAIGIEAPSRAGYVLGLFTLSMAMSSLVYGRLRGRIGIPALFGIGFSLMAIGFGLVATIASYATIALAIPVAGTGLGLVIPNLMAGAMTLAPPTARGRVAGGLTAGIFIGQFVSPFVSQPWIEAFGYDEAFRAAGWLLAAVAFLSALLGRRGRVRGREAGSQSP